MNNTLKWLGWYKDPAPSHWKNCGHKRHLDDLECPMCEKLEREAIENKLAEESMEYALFGQEAIDEQH